MEKGNHLRIVRLKAKQMIHALICWKEEKVNRFKGENETENIKQDYIHTVYVKEAYTNIVSE